MYSVWEQIASVLEQRDGVLVNWDEGFFVCPYCHEMIYRDDNIKDDECPFCRVLLV